MTIEFLNEKVSLSPEAGKRILTAYSDVITFDSELNRGSIKLGKGDGSDLTKNNEYYLVMSALEAVGMKVGSFGGGDIQFSASQEAREQKIFVESLKRGSQPQIAVAAR